MFAIAGRELRSLFFSPLAWILIGVMQFILAWLFLIQLEEFLKIQPQLATLESAPGVTDLVVAPLLESAAVILMLLTPLLSMRLISEEFRSGTIDLLLSAPISMLRILLGKYLALLAIYGAILLLIALMPLSLLLGAHSIWDDWPPVCLGLACCWRRSPLSVYSSLAILINHCSGGGQLWPTAVSLVDQPRRWWRRE